MISSTSQVEPTEMALRELLHLQKLQMETQMETEFQTSQILTTTTTESQTVPIRMMMMMEYLTCMILMTTMMEFLMYVGTSTQMEMALTIIQERIHHLTKHLVLILITTPGKIVKWTTMPIQTMIDSAHSIRTTTEFGIGSILTWEELLLLMMQFKPN